MTVILDNGQLKVTLSETETTKYNIDQVFFDRHGKESQMALLYLLKIATEKTTFKPHTSKFLIELYPIFNGGCEVFFIPDPKPVITSTPIDNTSVFEIDSSDALLSAIEYLYFDQEGQHLKASVVQHRSHYRLSVENMPKRLYNTILFNFSSRIPSKRRSKVPQEKPIVISENDAIQKIGRALAHHKNQL